MRSSVTVDGGDEKNTEKRGRSARATKRWLYSLAYVVLWKFYSFVTDHFRRGSLSVHPSFRSLSFRLTPPIYDIE